eukprot:1348724-Rhodomonas_salina.2
MVSEFSGLGSGGEVNGCLAEPMRAVCDDAWRVVLWCRSIVSWSGRWLGVALKLPIVQLTWRIVEPGRRREVDGRVSGVAERLPQELWPVVLGETPRPLCASKSQKRATTPLFVALSVPGMWLLVFDFEVRVRTRILPGI